MADYYDTLGVKKNASVEEIRRAFKILAQKYHPDKVGGDTSKFKEINEAYQTLSDEEKRRLYDQYGPAFDQAQSKGGFNGFDDFRDFASYAEAMRSPNDESNFNNFDFGNLGDVFGDLFGFSHSSSDLQQKKGQDIEINVSLDFREAIFGVEKKIRLEKYVKCDKCEGSGVEPGSKLTACQVCHGRGKVIQTQRTIFGAFQTSSVCPNCGGQGQVPDKKCQTCRGQGRTKKSSEIKVKIPAGIDNDQTIKVSEQGQAGRSGNKSGNLYINVSVRPDKEFERQGNDIFSEKIISLSQAALGDETEVETIDGEIKVKIPAGISSGQEIRLRNRGVPILNAAKGFLNRNKVRGDHILKIKVNVPKSLTKKQKELLEELKQQGL